MAKPYKNSWQTNQDELEGLNGMQYRLGHVQGPQGKTRILFTDTVLKKLQEGISYEQMGISNEETCIKCWEVALRETCNTCSTFLQYYLELVLESTSFAIQEARWSSKILYHVSLKPCKKRGRPVCQLFQLKLSLTVIWYY